MTHPSAFLGSRSPRASWQRPFCLPTTVACRTVSEEAIRADSGVLAPSTPFASHMPPPSYRPFPRWEWRRWENKLSPDAWKHGTPWSEQEIELLLQLVAPYPDDKIPWKDIAKHIEGRSAAWSKSAPGTA